MAETLLLKARGLARYSDQLSARPEGSLNAGSNVVINQPNIFSPRRGFERLDGAVTRQAKGLVPYADELLVYWDSTGSSAYVLSKFVESSTTWGSSTLSGYTSSLSAIRYAEAVSNLYVTGNTGVFKLASTSGAFVEAGVPEALGFTAANGAHATGAVGENKAVAYRILWGYKDANSNLIYGAPSNRVIWAVTAVGGRDVVLTVQVPTEIPSMVTAGFSPFIQVYKSAEVDHEATPSDTLYLTNEEFFYKGTTFNFVDADVTITTTNTIAEASHGLKTGMKATLSNVGGTLPGGLSAKVYYIIVVDSNTIKLADTAANAFEGTAVSITSKAGGGTHTLTLDNTVMHVIDQTPDSLTTPSMELYTNATREGTAQANKQAPKCEDLVVFNNHMFLANLTYRHTYSLQLLATSGSGLLAEDTITIAGTTYTAKASPSSSVPTEFQVYTGGSPATPATNIRDTMLDLVYKINTNSTTVYAYYDSLEGDLPGLIRIEERNFGGTAFSVSATTTGTSIRTPFSPDISTAAKTSTAESYANRLAWSKYGEFEAVPGSNWLDVGTRSGAIKRIMALRDGLFIFKEDGIWRLTGTSTSNFSIDLFDSSTRIIAPSSVAVLNNLIYGLFDQGICTVSEGQVSILSRDIEGDLRSLLGLSRANLISLSHACTYETERSYLLWVPEASTDTYATTCYMYNTLTAAWTTMDKSSQASVVNPYNDKLYIARGDTTYLSRERKTFTFKDYVDEQVDVIVSAVSGTTLTVNTLSGVEAGDIYYEASDKFSVITAIDAINSTITVTDSLNFSASVAKTFTAAVTDLCTAVGHYYASGLPVRLTTTTTLPAGLSTGTTYYASRISADTFKLCTTKSDAFNGENFINITGTGTGTHTITPWDTVLGAALVPEVQTFYRTTIEWNAIHLNSPAHLKQFYEVNFLTTKEFRDATASFKTNLSGSWADISFTGNPISLWGLFDWGDLPWGGDVEVVLDHRTYVPREKQRAGVLYAKFVIDTAFTDWELSGMELTYRNAGQRGVVK